MAKKVLNGLDLNNQRIVGLADPSGSTDAVNKQTLDAAVRGLTWKQAVKAASTTNVTLSSPGTTMDGVTLAANDRILLKNQTTASQNGIYVWTSDATALARANDANTSAQLPSATVTVQQGTVNGDTVWTQTADTITLDTTPITWVQVGGSSGEMAYAAGNGLTSSANTYHVGAGTGITVTADAVAINTSVVVRKYAVSIGDGTASTITVIHNLGTKDVTYSIQEASTGVFVDTDVTASGVNTLVFSFATPPTSGQYRVTVQA